jgi:hypothetical protein
VLLSISRRLITQRLTSKGEILVQITEEKLSEIENDLIRFFRNVALPRFMKEIRSDSNFDGHEEAELSHRFSMWMDETF